jgi:putative ABC transport system ATP-binding protein
MIRARSISKTYWQSGRPVPVLNDLSLSVAEGEFVALMGSSGAGKTTLMQLLGCLDKPSSGRYWLDGTEVSCLAEEGLASIRNRKIGFVFQTSHFVDYLDLVDNVSLPGFYAPGNLASEDRKRSVSLLEQMGLKHRTGHIPAALSGVERQRAAIARALFNKPKVILADEPTGNLDSENTERVMKLFSDLYRSGITIVLVTHDRAVADYANRTIELLDGGISAAAIH